MFKISPIIQNKSKAIVILMTMLLVMMGSCSIQKIALGDLFATLELTKQPKAIPSGVSIHSTQCSLSDDLVKASFLNIDELTTKNLSTPILLLTVIFGLVSFLLRSDSFFQKTTNTSSLAYSIPLFLKNRTLII